MKIGEKLNYLFDNHLSELLKTRREVEDELSKKQAVFCVCGALATGLHESYCRKFRKKVDSEAVKRMKHLLKGVKCEKN